MKVSVNCGHTSSGAGYGAVSGKFKESEITRLVGKEVIRLLKSRGHTVNDSTVDAADSQNGYLKAVTRKVNIAEPDLFISIHCNASVLHTANGMEVFTYKGRKLDKAVHICYELSRLGFKNRGIKDGSDLYVIRNTTAPAILIELFFLDNKTDQSLYNKNGYRGIAKAIVEAIG